MKKIKIKNKILSKSLIKFYEGDDFKELRDYIPGEDIRNIHWISSAKHQKLLSIEKEQLKNQKIALILLLDKNMLFEDKLDVLLETFEILAFSGLFYKQKVEVFVVTDSVKNFHIKSKKDINKVKEFIKEIDLKKVTLKKFYFKEKYFLAIYLGDFFYKIKLNPKNKNTLLFIRKKIEENPKSLLFSNLVSIDKKLSTFLSIDNLKFYIQGVKKIDRFYKKNRVRKIYSKENLLSILKETFE